MSCNASVNSTRVIRINRILVLLQRKMLNWNKKSRIKMLKTALFDCATNVKCCRVDGGRGHLPSFFVPTPGNLTAQKSPPLGICHPRQKKCQCPGVSPGVVGGGGWGVVVWSWGLGTGGIDWCINLSIFIRRMLLKASLHLLSLTCLEIR